MSFVGRYTSNYEVARHDSSSNAYRTSTNHFYTPSRQQGQPSYGRGSSSGPGMTTNTSRFSLVQKKGAGSESADLRQSLATRTQTQSASKYPSYDYSQRRLVDLGISQMGEAAKMTSYSKPYYRTTGAHDYSQYSTLDKQSTFIASKYQNLGSYSRYGRDEDYKRKLTDTPGADKNDDTKFRESVRNFGTTLQKDNGRVPKIQAVSNFEESNGAFTRFQRGLEENRAD